MNSFDLPRRFRIEENIHTKAAVVSRREGVVLRVALRADICLEGGRGLEETMGCHYDVII